MKVSYSLLNQLLDRLLRSAHLAADMAMIVQTALNIVFSELFFEEIILVDERNFRQFIQKSLRKQSADILSACRVVKIIQRRGSKPAGRRFALENHAAEIPCFDICNNARDVLI